MKFYRAYLENDGRNRRGASQNVPATKREDQKLWWSPASTWVVWDYLDSSKNKCRKIFQPEQEGDHTFRVFFFDEKIEKELEVKECVDLLRCNSFNEDKSEQPKVEKPKRVRKKKTGVKDVDIKSE